ncbi:MAG: phosphoserine phosphatase SerB [Betaproteobacteria bacterium RIFCSPLOWO2_02_FULL_66_14]|nr:MAG: phosphoserine phosphatase SerB [Betaproteobacteria bacterium RIFCSPLOWO2_02_FULL_66_14]
MNLVIQGEALTPDQLGELVALVQANHVVTLGAHAYRLTGAAETAAAEPWCAQRRLDFAWVPDDRRLQDLRLVAMDMDSTLVTIESIDEMGDLLGIRDRIAAITRRAMRGELDYPASLRERVALLAGLEEQALERICEERMALSPGAEALVLRCRREGIRTLLVSGGFNFFTAWLQQRLGIDDVLSNVLEIRDGRLTGRVLGNIVDGNAKAAKLRDEIALLGISESQVLAIGDGANDIPMMAIAGLSVAYRAKPLVREHATHVLDHAQLDGVLNLFL